MNKHNNKALSICKYVLDSMIYRQKSLGEEENLKNKLALIEEYRDCLLYTSPPESPIIQLRTNPINKPIPTRVISNVL